MYVKMDLFENDMKIIQPSVEILSQEYTLYDILKHIEKCARICYASEPKDTISSEQFVDNLVTRGHLSPLEHGTVYLYFQLNIPIYSKKYNEWIKIINFYNENPYSKVHIEKPTKTLHNIFITTNYRVIVENQRFDDLQFLSQPTEFHFKRTSVLFNCSIGVSRELNRHRVNSISERSTRYCNFSHQKFGSEVTFMASAWYIQGNKEERERFEQNCKYAEMTYLSDINSGLRAEQARDFLPLCTATEMVHTAFNDDWEHLIILRTDKAAHPDAQMLISKLKLILCVNK